MAWPRSSACLVANWTPKSNTSPIGTGPAAAAKAAVVVASVAAVLAAAVALAAALPCAAGVAAGEKPEDVERSIL